MGFYKNDATAANNTALNGINAQGGASPQNIDNLIRELAAQGKQFALDISGATTVGGTADAITISANDSVADAYFDGMLIGFVAGSDNATTTTTANVNSIGAEPIKKALYTNGTETALAAGDIQSGGLYLLRWRSSWDSSNGAWQLIDLQHGIPARAKLSANLSLYVNGSTGSDSNDGLSSGAAFATLQKAADVAFGNYDLGGYDITINVAAGTYTSGVWVDAPQVGAGSIIFQGDTTTPSNCTINVTGASVFRASAGAKLHVRGFKLNMAGSTYQVLAEYSGLIYLDGKNEHAGTSGHRIAATYGGSVSTTAEEVISGTVPGSHYLALGGHIYCQGATWTGSGTPTQSSFAQAGNAGLIFAFANSSTGSFTGSRYNANANGVIRVNGGGASYFPGSTAGSTSSGGQYL